MYWVSYGTLYREVEKWRRNRFGEAIQIIFCTYEVCDPIIHSNGNVK